MSNKLDNKDVKPVSRRFSGKLDSYMAQLAHAEARENAYIKELKAKGFVFDGVEWVHPDMNVRVSY